MNKSDGITNRVVCPNFAQLRGRTKTDLGSGPTRGFVVARLRDRSVITRRPSPLSGDTKNKTRGGHRHAIEALSRHLFARIDVRAVACLVTFELFISFERQPKTSWPIPLPTVAQRPSDAQVNAATVSRPKELSMSNFIRLMGTTSKPPERQSKPHLVLILIFVSPHITQKDHVVHAQPGGCIPNPRNGLSAIMICVFLAR